MAKDPGPVMLSYAQNFEDVMLARALGSVENGFYVDVGAWHPQDESVTYHFYQNGWRGVNVEPNPAYFDLVKTQRTRDINIDAAIGSTPGRASLTIVRGTGMSTLDASVAAKLDQAKYTTISHEVDVVTLDSVFEAHAPRDVHFLKIDCEGGEKAVLEGFDLKRFRPWIILVEATEPMSTSTNHESWDALITGRGYEFVYFDGLNRFYLADEKQDLKHHFATPPNVFDHFVVARMVTPLIERIGVLEQDLSQHTISAAIRRVLGLAVRKPLAPHDYLERASSRRS